jgi:hypothetical protein
MDAIFKPGKRSKSRSDWERSIKEASTIQEEAKVI